MHALGVHLGFGFSAGLFDYVLNFSLSTRPLLLIPVGLAYFALYYFLFRFFIVRFDLKTLGRETDEVGAARRTGGRIGAGLCAGSVRWAARPTCAPSKPAPRDCGWWSQIPRRIDERGAQGARLARRACASPMAPCRWSSVPSPISSPPKFATACAPAAAARRASPTRRDCRVSVRHRGAGGCRQTRAGAARARRPRSISSTCSCGSSRLCISVRDPAAVDDAALGAGGARRGAAGAGQHSPGAGPRGRILVRRIEGFLRRTESGRLAGAARPPNRPTNRPIRAMRRDKGFPRPCGGGSHRRGGVTTYFQKNQSLTKLAPS